MQEAKLHDLCALFDDTISRIFTLETIIKSAKALSLQNEIDSRYYSLSSSYQRELSEERNHNINMLEIALKELNSLKESSFKLENCLSKIKL